MDDIFVRIWHNLIERTEGPMHFRFFLQPTMSLIFAIRAAMKDVRAGTVPYLWRFFSSEKGKRTEVAKEAWKDVGKIFILGTILDVVYQLVVIFSKKTEEKFYPLESLLVAFALALVPYLLFRGPVNRLVRMFVKPKPDENNKS